MSRFIVISGLPASGKTSLISGLKVLNQDIAVVPEHIDWVNGKFPPKPTNKQEKIDKQKFFLDLDIQRYKWAKDKLKTNELVVSDTDFLSPLAHNFAERYLLPDFDIYEWMIEEYSLALKSGDIALPDIYIYLDAPLNKRSEYRGEDFNESGRKRNDMFFTSPFPENMRKFHHILMHDDSEHKCLNANWYLNDGGRSQAVSDVYKQITEAQEPKHTAEKLIAALDKTINNK